MISLVILNWERIKNVIRNVTLYSSYQLIDEIIVFNNNNKYSLNAIKSDKIIVVESSKDLGLYSRFAAAGLSRNDCILHCDDDLLIPEITVQKLYEYWINTPDICHGTQGRVVRDEYNMKPAFGEVQIVLTRCMLVSKVNCLSAFKFANFFNDMNCDPKGNGEDIILSFIAISSSGKLNRSYELPYTDCLDDLPNGLNIAISKRWTEHVEHRTKVVKKCRTLLEMP